MNFPDTIFSKLLCFLKPEAPKCNDIRKSKSITNLKIKNFNNKRNYYDCIVLRHVDTKNINNKNNYFCTGRTVKEITNYFENIAKVQNDNTKRGDTSNCNIYNSRVDISMLGSAKSHSILQGLKPRIPQNVLTSAPFSFARKSNYLKCEINLQTVWKQALLNGKSLYFKPYCIHHKKHNRQVFNLKESLKTSFVAGILMLQYVI